MLLDKEGVSDKLRYREAIRSALLRAQGRPIASRRSLDDARGSSIHAEVRAVMGEDGHEAGTERTTRTGRLRPQEECGRQSDAAPVSTAASMCSRSVTGRINLPVSAEEPPEAARLAVADLGTNPRH